MKILFVIASLIFYVTSCPTGEVAVSKAVCDITTGIQYPKESCAPVGGGHGPQIA